MEKIEYVPIGIVRSPFKTAEGSPIQPVGARGVRGQIELREELAPALKDLDGFSHLILLYHFHLSKGFELEVKPFLDDARRGLFATRAPRRPNPVGFSVVRLVGVQGASIAIEDVDVLDGTPVLDIKPYVPLFDSRDDCQIGWFSGKLRDVENSRADERFK